MKIPNLEKAEEYLLWAGSCNPGVWTQHSRVVAEAAGKIAEVSSLDRETAEILGLLHDIGRYVGPTSMMHIYDGYKFLKKEGYDDAAQICITHSFPIQDISVYSGANDCAPDIYDEVVNVLDHAVYSDYDRLIQICDSIALPEGVCLLEKRLLDVSMRHGVKDNVVDKWTKIFEIWDEFSRRSGKNLYTLFPEVVRNTFGVF